MYSHLLKPHRTPKCFILCTFRKLVRFTGENEYGLIANPRMNTNFHHEILFLHTHFLRLRSRFIQISRVIFIRTSETFFFLKALYNTSLGTLPYAFCKSLKIVAEFRFFSLNFSANFRTKITVRKQIFILFFQWFMTDTVRLLSTPIALSCCRSGVVSQCKREDRYFRGLDRFSRNKQTASVSQQCPFPNMAQKGLLPSVHSKVRAPTDIRTEMLTVFTVSPPEHAKVVKFRVFVTSSRPCGRPWRRGCLQVTATATITVTACEKTRKRRPM